MFRQLSVALIVLLSVSGQVFADQALLDQVDGDWNTERYKTRSQQVTGFLMPLGAMQKISGIWQLSDSARLTGQLTRATWEVSNGAVLPLFQDILDSLNDGAELKFSCNGRSCGNASEWANKVYGERLLYGRDEFMRYAAYQLSNGDWVSVFSAARTANRQYLHIDWLQVKAP